MSSRLRHNTYQAGKEEIPDASGTQDRLHHVTQDRIHSDNNKKEGPVFKAPDINHQRNNFV